MQFTTTSQKVHILEANVTGMNTTKNQHFFKKFRKTTRAQNTIKKFIVDDKETTDQTHILECIK